MVDWSILGTNPQQAQPYHKRDILILSWSDNYMKHHEIIEKRR